MEKQQMKPNELRIGNYYYWGQDNEILQVTLFDFYELYTGEENIDSWKPIPLTEEWLLKFGFKYNKKEMGFLKDNFHIEVRGYGCPVFVYPTFHLTDIKHVHQLQNLYFSLTGEELTIKGCKCVYETLSNGDKILVQECNVHKLIGVKEIPFKGLTSEEATKMFESLYNTIK